MRILYESPRRLMRFPESTDPSLDLDRKKDLPSWGEPRRARWFRFLFVVPACCLGMVLGCLPSLAPPEPEDVELAGCKPRPEPPSAPVLAIRERHAVVLEPGEVDAYAFDLAVGEIAHAEVEQRGHDLVATLYGPQCELLVVDAPIGKRGVEDVVWVAEVAGSYLLTVEGLEASSAPQPYDVELTVRRRASDRDQFWARAVRKMMEGEELRLAGQLGEAAEVYRVAELYWRETEHRESQARALYLLGTMYDQDRRSPEETLGAFEQARALYEQVGNTDMQAQCLRLQGTIHQRLGDFEKASEALERALPLFTEPERKGQTFNNLGYNAYVLGQHDLALRRFDQALELYRNVGSFAAAAITLHNRGKIYFFLGKDQYALDDLTDALAIRRREGYRQGEGSTLHAIGQIHQQRQQYDLAIEHFERALQIRREVDDRRGEAVTLNGIGQIYQVSGRSKEALDAYIRALEIFRGLEDRHQEAKALLHIGELYEGWNRTRDALTNFSAALAIYQGIGDPAGQIEILGRMAAVEQNRGQLEEAGRLLSQALDKIERFRLDSGNLDLRASYLASKHEYLDAYVDLLMKRHESRPQDGFDAAALAASERSRARSLLDGLIERLQQVHPARRWKPSPDVLAELQTIWRQIQQKQAQRRRLQDLDPERLAPVEKELRRLLQDYYRKRRQARGFTALELQPEPAHTLQLQEIQDHLLDPQTLLLEYHLGAEQSYLWAVSTERLSTFTLPGQDEIERAARLTHELLRNSHRVGTKQRTDDLLAELAELVLAPVVHLLPGKRLLLVTEGSLQYVPFTALPIPGSGGVPLVAEHEVIGIPSASAFAALRRRVQDREPAAGLLAIVADPIVEERLPFSRQEAETIVELAPPGRRLVALGPEASRETVIDQLGDFRYLHFATHGILDTAQPGLSHLMLSVYDKANRYIDGALYADEIFELDLAADLVVLSACSTALGKEIRGEGLVGLTQGFLNAGAARIVVSLWDVDDRATAALMASFYKHLWQGSQPAAALRQAQLEIRQKTPWEAPYYWAPFIFQGEWH